MRNLLMNRTHSYPIALLRNLERELQQPVFSVPEQTTTTPTVPVNILANETSLRIQAILPGLDLDKLDVEVLGNVLSLSGNRIGENFSRKITLPFEVELEEVEARYELGILNISAPKAKKQLPKKIEVQ